MEPPRKSSSSISGLLAAISLVLLSGAVLADSPPLPAVPDASHAGGTSLLNVVVVVLLVLANGFFVASEFALVAVRKTRIDQLAAEGGASARAVQSALGDLDRYIAATQVGITVASLLLGGIGERTLHALFEPLLHWIPSGLPAGLTSSAVAFGLAYFTMTTMHVVIGELMPKSIALQFAEKTTLVIIRPMMIFAKLFHPLIWLLNGTGVLLLRAIGVRAAEGHGSVHSPEELDLLVSQSHEGGELNDTEAEILHRVVRFSDLTLREVMVPRVEMQTLPVELTLGELRHFIQSKPHSRVPVFHGSVDEVIGIVHLKDLVPYCAGLGVDEARTVTLMPVVRDAPRFPETSTVDKMLLEFKARRQQLAIVIDEYGGTAGMVTLGDLLEQVFGEVADEFDPPEIKAVEDREGRISLAGRTLIDEVNDKYEAGFPVEDADTVAGLVLSVLGRPAVPGDEVRLNGFVLRVEEVERLRITRLAMWRETGEGSGLPGWDGPSQ